LRRRLGRDMTSLRKKEREYSVLRKATVWRMDMR